MFEIGQRIKTMVGKYDDPHWAYGTITDKDGLLFRCEWDGGGFDYQYDFEIEPA